MSSPISNTNAYNASNNANANNRYPAVGHSNPIPIASRGRARSVSVSSASSGGSAGSPTSDNQPATPPSTSIGSQRIAIPSPSQSPILSYFLAQSPSKSAATNNFPFKRFGTNPVFEVDEEAEKEIPAAIHARRASATVASRFSGQQPPQLPESFQGRGNGLLRRLSLSSPAFVKPPTGPPSPPPNTAVLPTPRNAPFEHNSNGSSVPRTTTKPRRSATLSTGDRPRRAPSPMGERILKGHFDGFN